MYGACALNFCKDWSNSFWALLLTKNDYTQTEATVYVISRCWYIKLYGMVSYVWPRQAVDEMMVVCRYYLRRLFLIDNAVRRPDESAHQKQNVEAGVYPEHTSRRRWHQRRVCWSPVWQCIPGWPCGSEAKGIASPAWPTDLLQYLLQMQLFYFRTSSCLFVINVCVCNIKTNFVVEIWHVWGINNSTGYA